MLRFFVVTLIVMSVSVFAQDSKEHVEKSEQIAHKVSQLTGTAVNPLLVSGAIGAYKYYSTPVEARSQLPWYYQSWFFAICLALALLAFIVSCPSIIANLPSQISGFVELCNKQIGLVLATPGILSTIMALGSDLVEAQAAASISQPYLYASFLPIELPQNIWFISIVPMLLFVFFAIWLLNFVFDVFIFFSPFGWFELGLKILRGIFYVTLLTVTIFFPQMVFVLVIPIAIISVILFGWSIRRVIMGFVFLKDFLNRKKEKSIDKDEIAVFADSSLGCPAKCYGVLTVQDENLVFSYKKFFLFRKIKTINNTELVLKKGFLYSTLYNNGTATCSLPPRYQKITEQVRDSLRIQKFEDSTLKKGFRGAIEWIKEFKNEGSANQSKYCATRR